MTGMTGLSSKQSYPGRNRRASGTLNGPGGSPPKEPSGTETTQESLGCGRVLRERPVSGVVVVDGKRKITSLTRQARQLLNLAGGEASLPAFAALPAGVQAILGESLVSGGASVERVIEQKLGGGGARTLHVSATLLKPGKKGSGVILVLTDLTPTRQLDERLEQLDRLASIGTLAASMAHEIRNALVAGRTFVDLLLEKHQDTELVGVVRRELGRIDEIVSRILKFGGPARPALRQVRLHEVLDHSLRLVQPQLNGKQVLLSRSFQAVPDLVKGDDCQLQQAFVNLFLNALEAMGPNGTLSVTTELVVPGGRADRTQVQVAIQDSGLGIPPEHLERVFEPFFTSKPSGTGLGLPITRRIIREHRGDIRVVSRPSKGSDFRVLLPVSA